MRFGIIMSICLLPLIGIFLDYLDSNRHELDNEPPQVTIVKPDDKAVFKWNSLIPYSIMVSDQEDGQSVYDEIPESRVFLEVHYFSSGLVAAKFAEDKTKVDRKMLRLMGQSDCLNCHAARTKMIGPSFARIAGRYAKSPTSLELLSDRLISGSTGIWGDEPIPPHPNLEIEGARNMVEWILALDLKPNYGFHIGTEGSFRTKEKVLDTDGVYLLTASYADNGIQDIPNSSKESLHTIMLKEK